MTPAEVGLADALPALDEWYLECGRHSLPWRQTRDSYAVLVSEVMLQQTQVSRALPAYTAWLERWPTVNDLAAAVPGEVIRAWAGMGYNRRAVNLHRAARAVTDTYDGVVPLEVDELRNLPGIGPYTAAAVASFAGERPVPVLDTNVARVLARAALGVALPRETTAARLRGEASRLAPCDGVACRHHNLALMDLGAMVCTARRPQCSDCPFARACAWRAAGAPSPVVTIGRTPPFERTARFARGKIVDALRARPRTAAALAVTLPAEHAARIDTYLAALASDGLVTNTDDMWSLPSDQGKSSIASPKE